ncbi:MAG: NAD(P)-dependent glycerol-3-phosphate dehydrogenase [Chloroflexi bacterium]|nr:NAD(P)-dependent glycerol-3-phosphate dehydrogenase [Chloroflexota bacterium]
MLNAGGWGTALAVMLARQGHDVMLWARRSEAAICLRESRRNAAYLPGVEIPSEVAISSDLAEVLAGRSIVGVAAISAGLRGLAQEVARLLDPDALVFHGTKGFELDTLATGSQVLAEELGPRFRGRIAALSGPTHAEEVGNGLPTAAVLACPSGSVAAALQAELTSAAFRVYTNPDVIGVEVCASLKNVIALAAGVGDGLGFGDNAKAALITRGLAEMGRLAAALGGQRETASGLAGLGDVVATCTSRHSRNRRAGELLGQGRSLASVLAETRMVIEGVPATRAAARLAERTGVELPISRQVVSELVEGQSPLSAIAALMGREATTER